METAPLEVSTDIAVLWTAPTWADDRSVDETIVHYTHRLGRLRAFDGYEANVELIESVTLHLDATPILIMSRIREETQEMPLREAVLKALSQTGTTITSAGLVLAGSFIVLTAVAGSGSGGAQIRDIGLGLAFGILMDTFLVRTLLVPHSTVVLLGRWNWWPSRLSREDAV